MYNTTNDAYTALANSCVFEMFNFDDMHLDCVVGYMRANNKTPEEAACWFGVLNVSKQ